MKMNRISFLMSCFLVIGSSPSYSAERETTSQQAKIPLNERSWIEFKTGYFFFTDHHMRKVYKHGGFDGQISASCCLYKLLRLYASVEYLERSGRSLHGHQRTFIWEVPLSLGLQVACPIQDWVQYYATLGPRYFFVQARNHSSHVPKHMHSDGCGGFVNTGFAFVFGKHFLLDLFGEYSYRRLHFHSKKHETKGHTVQVGGLTFGGGLGYVF